MLKVYYGLNPHLDDVELDGYFDLDNSPSGEK